MIHPIKRLGDRPPIEVEIPDDTPTDERLRVAVVAAVQAGVRMDHADFSDATLCDLVCPYGASFDGARFDGASFDWARFYGASFDGASFYGASFYGARFYGARFYGASFDGANFYGASFDGARFDGARFDGASFYGELLVGVRPILQIAPIGSRNDTLLILRAADGLHVSTGCFSGPVDDFLSRVGGTHGGNDHARAYFAAIDFARILLPPATSEEIAAAKAAEDRIKKMMAERTARKDQG